MLLSLPRATVGSASPAVQRRTSLRRCRATAAPSPRHRMRHAGRAHAADADSADAERDAPWNVGIYFTKRPVHRTDAIGGIPEESMDNLVDPPSWDASGKLRLAVTIVARDLRLDPATVYSRLEQLKTLVPDLASRMSTMRAGDLARLAASVSDVATALLRMRNVFPTADVSKMVAQRPLLLLMPAEEVQRRAVALRQLLPGVDADAAAAEQPLLLDVEDTKEALDELARLMPGANVVRMLANDTSLLTSVQKGKNLIHYDNGTLAQLQESLRGGPDAAPDGW